MVALFDTAGRVDLELERFESISAGDRFSLLRVDGRWLLAPGVSAPTPVLVVQRGALRDRFAPLPGADTDYDAGDERLWSAGYAVPLDLVLDARVRYWLHAGDARFPLPGPQERALYDGQRAEVVIRNGRPHVMLAAGLMAVAIGPLSAPALASAQDAAAPVTTTAPDQTTVAAAPAATTPSPPAATTPAPPATTPAPPATTTPAPTAAPTEAAPADDTPAAPVVAKPAKPKKKAATPKAESPNHERRAKKTPAKKAKKAKKRHHRKHQHAAPAAQAAPVIHAGLDPTPSVRRTPVPLREAFSVPPFLLPIYQAASAEYDVPWRVLAAINQVETDFGRNLNVSSAGAQGWMQFMPSTWNTYGVDANLDGRRDPSNPADAIFAAARYLHAAGASTDLRGAVFAYNHADWYVDTVMAKARAFARIPNGAVAALTGLAIGRFPVPGPHVAYAHAAEGWVTADGTAHTSTVARISGPAGREVVAPTTVRVLYLGRSHKGVFAVLEDAYGNRFTYGHLAHTVRRYARLRTSSPSAAEIARELHLHVAKEQFRTVAYKTRPAVTPTTWPTGKERIYAHPGRPGQAPLDTTPPSAIAASAHKMGVRPAEVVMARLRPGAVVPAGTVIGRLGGALTVNGRAHLILRIRPAGDHTHQIDPAPLLDAWRLAARGAIGPTTSHTPGGNRLTLGRAMLLGDRQLGRMVLTDARVHLTHAGRDDVRSGQIDRRVLVSLEALADAGLHPSVSALRSGADDQAGALGRGFEVVALNRRALAAQRDTTSPSSQALRVLRALPDPLAPRHAHLDGAATGTLATAASTSTSDGRLTVSFPRHPHTSAAVSRAVDAMLSGSPIAGAQLAGAPDLKGAPDSVRRIASGADAIAGLPYIWGGGHGDWDASGYDCSGSVSYALHAAGLLDAPLTSGELASYGEAGPGKWVTIYANPTHVIMEIGGQFYGTSGFGHPETGGGPGWFSVTPSPEYLAGFTVRHPAGL